MKHAAIAAVITVFLVRAVFAEDKSNQPIDQSSPQSVAEGFVKSMKNREWERAFRCLTLETQQYSKFMTMLPAGAVAGKDEAKTEALEHVLMKHGLASKDFVPKVQEMTDTRKLAAIIGDVMTWVSTNSSDDPEKQNHVLDRMAAVNTLTSRSMGIVPQPVFTRRIVKGLASGVLSELTESDS